MPDSDDQQNTQKTVNLHVRVRPGKKAEWQEKFDGGDTLSYGVRDAVDKWFGDEYVTVQALEHISGDGK